MDPTVLVALGTLVSAAVASLRGDKPLPQGPTVYGLTDRDLWGHVYTGRSPLGRMSFEQAVLDDPRRVFGLIEQAMLQGYEDIWPMTSEARQIQMAMHLEKWDLLRTSRDGRLTVQDMSNFERTYAPGFFEASMSEAPPEALAAFQARLPRMIEAFEQAQGIASRAAAIARTQSQLEAQCWRDLATTLGIIEDKAIGLAAAGPRQLPGHIEGMMLPATRRGGPVEDNA
jgi:hypothetical protein